MTLQTAQEAATAPVSDVSVAATLLDDHTLLRDWLRARDVPCPVCSYNLRALAGATCPECAAVLRLEVGSENLRLGPWFLGVIALAMAMGFDSVIATLMTVGLLIEPPSTPSEFGFVVAIYAIFIVLAIGCGIGLGVMVKKRRRWCRMPVRAQWIWAVVIFAGVGASHAIYGAMLAARM